jgi:hypothetical protein
VCLRDDGSSTIHVVMRGLGFGRIHIFKYLYNLFHNYRRERPTIVNCRNYSLFIPLLHEASPDRLMPGSSSESLRKTLNCTTEVELAAETPVFYNRAFARAFARLHEYWNSAETPEGVSAGQP